MTQPNDNFTPRRVDEQIEQLSPGADQSGQEEKASARLVRHLRTHYQREAAEQRQRSLENAWERIRQHATLATGETAPITQAEAPADPQREREDTGILWQPQRERDDLRLMPPNRGAAAMTRIQVRGLAAFVTIAAVVGLFALLLHTFAPAHLNANPASSKTPQATASRAPTPPGRWASIPGLSHIEQASLMIAPSNPQVVYEDLTPAGAAQFSLRRSDDGGATWHALVRPAGLPSAYDETSIVVSPLDPQTVILTLTIYEGAHPGACSSAYINSNALLASKPESGGASCGVQFYSSDGGAHWSRLQLPIAGAIGALGGNVQDPSSVEVLLPQDQRLYSAISASTVDNITFGGAGGRILASDDGGKTWKLVDADIQASGQHICSFAPAATGSIIFAITQTGNCYDTQSPSPSFLWRSNDGGAHWAQVSQLPGTANSMVLVSRGDGTDPLLYMHTPVYVQAARPDPQVAVSQDGGKTWQTAPTAGLPAPSPNQELFNSYGPFAALGDGSVVNIFPAQDGTLVFAAWKLGEKAWHRVAPDLAGIYSPLSFFITQGASSKVTFWLIAQNNTSASVFRYDLQ